MNLPGDNKPRVGLIPDYLTDVVRVMEHGADGDHEPHGWLDPEIDPNLFADALWRHAEEIRCGRLIDQKSGMPHAAHAASDAMMFGVRTRLKIAQMIARGNPGVVDFDRMFRADRLSADFNARHKVA